MGSEQTSKKNKKTMLLHSCCGPCSSSVTERLAEDYDLTVFFYNPNITDEAEYRHRESEQRRLLSETGLADYFEGTYDPQEFFDCTAGLENEPEGGRRCIECFRLRLREAARVAKEKGFDCFDTTLSVSPHKNYKDIYDIASGLAAEYGVAYAGGNYKKRDGFKRSIELSKEHDLYRQNYCGCCYSKR